MERGRHKQQYLAARPWAICLGRRQCNEKRLQGFTWTLGQPSGQRPRRWRTVRRQAHRPRTFPTCQAPSGKSYCEQCSFAYEYDQNSLAQALPCVKYEACLMVRHPREDNHIGGSRNHSQTGYELTPSQARSAPTDARSVVGSL